MGIYTDPAYLTPDTQTALSTFVERLRSHGLNPRIAETYRTQERQNKLYADSIRTGHIVTKTLHSWHTTRRAADVDITPVTNDNILFFLDSANSLGFRTLVNPDTMRRELTQSGRANTWDWHHVEYPAGRDYAQAIAEAKRYDGKGMDTKGVVPPSRTFATLSTVGLIAGIAIGLLRANAKR